MGYSVSTSAIWGANSLAPNTAFTRRCVDVVESAVFEHHLTPMLHLKDVVTLFDGLCVESDVTMLRLAEIQGKHCAGLMMPMMQGADTVSDALKVLLTFNCLHAQPIYWTPSVRGDHVSFAIWVDRPAEVTVKQSERMAAMGMLQFCAGFRDLLGDSFKPTVLRFKPSQVGNDWPTQFVGIPIERNATETEVLIPRSCLQLPNPLKNGGVGNPPRVEAELKRYREQSSAQLLRNETCSWIKTHLATGECDLATIAERMNCDKRTLQRKYKRELSCRFSDLVDDVRADVCLPLLESAIFPMQMIAEQLGYATSGNFSRFFQRRFNCTPRDWMRALGEGDDAQGARGRSNLMTADTFSGL
jgi:AraC-like DNA-binding protein